MLKALKKSRQKKEDTLDDTVLTIEFQLKKLSQKSKQYSEQIEALSKSIEFIEKAVKQEIAFKVSELHKEYQDASALIAKISKDFETLQKRYHKIQTEFEKKLFTPLASGLFNLLKPAVLEELQIGVKRIQDFIAIHKKSNAEKVDWIQIFTKRLSAVENKVHSICLPEQIEEIQKLNEKLNKYAESLCRDTGTINLSTSLPSGESQKIKTSLLLLFTAHQKGGLLLEQAQKNLSQLSAGTAIAPANLVAVADFKAAPTIHNG